MCIFWKFRTNITLKIKVACLITCLLQVLAEENQRQIVEFCKKEGLVLLADEVRATCTSHHQMWLTIETQALEEELSKFSSKAIRINKA